MGELPATCEALNKLATEHLCPKTTPTNLATLGFSKPFELIDLHTQVVENIEGLAFTHVRFEERTCNRETLSSMYRKEVNRKLKAGEPLSERDRRALRREIRKMVRSEADPTLAHIPVIFNFKQQELWIANSNPKQRKLILKLLSNIGLMVIEKPLSMTIEHDMEQLVRDPTRLPPNFELGCDVQLKRCDSSTRATYFDQDLLSSEIATNLEARKDVVQLGLVYRESVSFTLRSDQTITKLRCHDALVLEWLDFDDESLNDREDIYAAQRTKVSFYLTMFRHLLPKIHGIFATLNKEQEAQFELKKLN